MKTIRSVNEGILNDEGGVASVAMVDSGFSALPPYAVMHGVNRNDSTAHGDRTLSVFTALDKTHPLPNLVLNLSCYDPSAGYGGLMKAFEMLPDSDILSVSISWKDDIKEIRDLLESKFKTVCVPCSDWRLPYPALYGFTVKCSFVDDARADYCIDPNPAWRGNSYAVPAVARLLSYGVPMDEIASGDGTPVTELFKDCNVLLRERNASMRRKMSCPHCHRYMRSGKTQGFVTVDLEECPYCGMPLKG